MYHISEPKVSPHNYVYMQQQYNESKKEKIPNSSIYNNRPNFEDKAAYLRLKLCSNALCKKEAFIFLLGSPAKASL